MKKENKIALVSILSAVAALAAAAGVVSYFMLRMRKRSHGA